MAPAWIAVLVLMVGLAGCASKGADPTVATAQTGGPPRPTPSTSALTQYVDAQRAWVGCLRQHGFNLPDPDAKGAVDFGGFLTSNKLAKTDPQLVAAENACQQYQHAVPPELQDIPPVTAEQLANRRAYAKCMRANGVANYPDPLANGDWPDYGRELTPAEAAVNDKALQICDPVIDGRPPASYDPNKKSQG